MNRFRGYVGFSVMTDTLPLAGSFHDDLPELGIGDQPAGGRSLHLYSIENSCSFGFGHLQAEFLRLEADAVESALFAQHDLTLCSDQLSRIGFDRFRHMELAGHSAAFADK